MHSYGWDVSTSIIGFAELDENGKLVRKSHCDLRKKNGLLEKGDVANAFVRMVKFEPGSKHFVEDRLSGFTPGKSSAGTLLTLAAFNAMVSYFIHEQGGTVHHLHPSTVKSALGKLGLVFPKGSDKKDLTLQWARNVEPKWTVDHNRNNNLQPWNFDEADAFALAQAGRIKNPS